MKGIEKEIIVPVLIFVILILIALIIISKLEGIDVIKIFNPRGFLP